jgi:glycosyltransferase involved in cell wall biosynthesis
MIVLFITPRFSQESGGDGLYAFLLARQLQRLQHTVIVFTIKNSKFVKITAREEDSIESSICEEYETTDANELEKNFYSRAALRSFRSLLLGCSPDVIHIHGIHQYFTLSVGLALKGLRLPLLYTLHDYKILCGNAGFFSDHSGEPCIRCLHGNSLYPLIERCKQDSFGLSVATSLQMFAWHAMNFIGRVNRFHAPSAFAFDLLSKNVRFTHKLTAIRYPILEQQSEARHLSLGDVNIVFVGRMVPHKGAAIFAEAVKSFSVPIHVFGDGPEFPRVKELLGTNSNVTLHGWSARSDIQSYVGENTIVVLPYLTHETFCFAVLEAMLQGACVVTTSRGAIPELVEHNVNGIIVENPTPEDFHRAIADLLLEPSRIRALGKVALQIKNDLDSWEKHATKIVTLYKTLIA